MKYLIGLMIFMAVFNGLKTFQNSNAIEEIKNNQTQTQKMLNEFNSNTTKIKY